MFIAINKYPTEFERGLMRTIDWDSRLILIRGPKGVGKSTLILWFRTGKTIEPIPLDQLLLNAPSYCLEVRKLYHPLEFYEDYLKRGYYPFSFEKPKTYKTLIENVTNYTIESELTKFRGVSQDNTRKIKALLQVVAEMLPYLVDISKLSKSVSIDRVTLIRYLKYLDEAKLTRSLFMELDKITDLQKPEKILFDNSNLVYALSVKQPETGTIRETFFCNQLASAGHTVEYSGSKTGDFRIDKRIIIEVGGKSKDYSQISDEDIPHAALAVDDSDYATTKKIPLWAFGFLY